MDKSSLRFLCKVISFRPSEPLLPPKKHNFNAFARSTADYVGNVLRNRRDNLKMLQVAYGYLCQSVSPTVDHVSVLDFGCAFSPIGQAYAIEAGLVPTIDSYFGIDIDRRAIDWCHQISALRPEFAYASYNAAHEKYYSTAAQGADSQEKPAQFQDLARILGERRFDLQVSSSVFTHLYLVEFVEFLSIIMGHMHAGSVLFNSVFLVDEDFLNASNRLDARLGKPDRDFTPSPIEGLGRGSYVTSLENPRSSVGYSRPDLFDCLRDFPGIKCEAVLHGDWRGVQHLPLSHNYQDWIVLRKI